MISLFYLSLHFKELGRSMTECFIYQMALIHRSINLDTLNEIPLQGNFEIPFVKLKLKKELST